MRTGGIILIVLAVIIGLFAMSYDTTVALNPDASSVLGFDRVQNIGKMQEKNTMLGVSGFMFIGGIILLAASSFSLSSARPSAKEDESEWNVLVKHDKNIQNELARVQKLGPDSVAEFRKACLLMGIDKASQIADNIIASSSPKEIDRVNFEKAVALIKSGERSALLHFLKSGVDVNIADSNGNTLLDYSEAVGQKEITQILLNMKAKNGTGSIGSISANV